MFLENTACINIVFFASKIQVGTKEIIGEWLQEFSKDTANKAMVTKAKEKYLEFILNIKEELQKVN